MSNLLATLMQSLQDRSLYPHPVDHFQVIETHISYILLTGQFAYKLKKPVNFGFLDFSTLERRHRFCEEEVRLNRRLAPDLYLGVVAICGSPEHPGLDAEKGVFEYAVKMRQFDHRALLDAEARAGVLGAEEVDAIVDTLVSFHATSPVVADNVDYGLPDRVHFAVLENFSHIRPCLTAADDLARLNHLEEWSQSEFERLGPQFIQRRAAGRVRECHGDLHLRNIARIGEKLVPFDGIEFNPGLRWIDVISELAFLIMDLDAHELPELGRRVLNAYLEQTGDYKALGVLRYYLVYRAMVRAKVAQLRAVQDDTGAEERDSLISEYHRRITQAETYTRPADKMLIITCGLSGSGKTSVSQELVEAMGVIRVRSDVERKRMFGLTALEDSASNIDGGIYAEDVTERTYGQLAELTQEIVNAGFSVIVDATFLQLTQRQTFQQLATNLNVPFVILHTTLVEPLLRQRLAQRNANGRDASEATMGVLERQLLSQQLPSAEEARFTVEVDTSQPLDPASLTQRIKKIAG